MSCPAWEDCNIKGCIERYQCTNKDYWNSSIAILHRETIRRRKQLAKAAYLKHKPFCEKTIETCDKKSTCSLLAQCIFTIPRLQDKPELLEALRGTRSPEGVIKILRDHDPEPMRSYYFCQDRKRKK